MRFQEGSTMNRPFDTTDKLHYTTRVIYTSGGFVCVEANI